MASGKMLDAFVAENVLGWRRQGGSWVEPDFEVELGEVPAFSTDIAAAWKLADRICEAGYRLRIEGSKIWRASFYKSVAHTLETQMYSGTARNPAEAICMAALASKGLEAPNASSGETKLKRR